MLKAYENTLKNSKEKLINVNYELKNSLISKIIISGDFFIYPEESITLIEKTLLKLEIDASVIAQKLSECVDTNNIELLGISVNSLTEAILTAREIS